MGREMNYAVYQPAHRTHEEELPLVVFLHGGGDDVDCFDRARVGQHLDAAISEGRIPRVVVAVPEGDLGFWENWADGSRNYRDWVIEEMLPAVQQTYRTQSCPKGCHVMGISMGGHGALRFAFKAPQYFSSVTALSAPVFDTEQMLNFRDSFWWGLFVPVGRIWGKSKDPQVVMRDDLYAQWVEQDDLHGLRLQLAWGDHDRKGVIRTSERFVEHLRKHRIDFSQEVFEGKHKWNAWVPAIERAIAVQVGRPH